MAQLNQLTVLSDLPKFTGNPKEGEPYFKSELDARTFLRTLENHFSQHGITSNSKQIQIMFSLIDKKKGDAVRLLTCYAGRTSVPFEDIKNDFLNMYPSFQVTEFRHAAQALLGTTKLAQNNMFCAMTALENASRAVSEAYLKTDAINKGDFNDRTLLPPNVLAPNVVAPDASSDDDQEAPAAPGPQRISLLNLLQNFTMHLFIAQQTPNKVYDHLAKFGPRNASTRFMAECVKTVEKHKLTNSKKRVERNENEVIFKASHDRQPQLTQKVQQTPRVATNNVTSPKTTYQQEVNCYNCGKPGHVKRDCKNCAFCKKPGHSAKVCRARLAQAKGKFCDHCQIADSHNTDECYVNKARGQQTHREPRTNIRLAHSDEQAEDTEQRDSGNVEWTTPDYHSDGEEADILCC